MTACWHFVNCNASNYMSTKVRRLGEIFKQGNNLWIQLPAASPKKSTFEAERRKERSGCPIVLTTMGTIKQEGAQEEPPEEQKRRANIKNPHISQKL